MHQRQRHLFVRTPARQSTSSSRTPSSRLQTSSSSATNNSRGSRRRSSSDGRLSEELLRQISSDILDKTKQLGCFDEIRMQLLETVEASEQFAKVEREFIREINSYCSTANLSLPRAKLRERLNPKMLAKSMSRLGEHLQEISRQNRPTLKSLYNEQALEHLKSIPRRVVGVERLQLVAEVASKNQEKAINNNNTNTKISPEACDSGGSPQTESSGTFSLSPPSSSSLNLTLAPANQQILSLDQIPLPGEELAEEEVANVIPTATPVLVAHPKKYKRFKVANTEKIEIKIRADSVCFQQQNRCQEDTKEFLRIQTTLESAQFDKEKSSSSSSSNSSLVKTKDSSACVEAVR